MAPSLEAEQSENRLEELGLQPGTTVEVLTMENRLTFVGKVESFRNGAIMIREAKGDELPPVLYNKEVKLRFFLKRKNQVFNGKICGSTIRFWKVDRLQSAFSKEQRAFFRQRISPNTTASCSKRSSPGNPGKRPAPCQIMDVSAGGLMISSREEYLMGDNLSITGARIVEEEAPFTFSCRVRRVGEPEMGVIRYGCQFETLSAKEQDRLLRAIFIAQREEIRRQKEHGEF